MLPRAKVCLFPSDATAAESSPAAVERYHLLGGRVGVTTHTPLFPPASSLGHPGDLCRRPAATAWAAATTAAWTADSKTRAFEAPATARFAPLPPPMGGMVLATSRKMWPRWPELAEGTLGASGCVGTTARVVGMLNEVPAAAEH